MKALGFVAPKEEIDAVFDAIDVDGSNGIEYAELNKVLRKQAAIDPSLQAGAAGDIVTESTNRTKLRRNAGGKKGAALAKGVRLDLQSEKPVVAQLCELLFEHAVRVIDLFRDWDEDGNGIISGREFRKAVVALLDGQAVGREHTDALFAMLDTDGDGSLEFGELNKMLRSGTTVQLAAKLQVGAAGKIVLESKNKATLRGGKALGPKTSLIARPPPLSARDRATGSSPRTRGPTEGGAATARERRLRSREGPPPPHEGNESARGSARTARGESGRGEASRSARGEASRSARGEASRSARGDGGGDGAGGGGARRGDAAPLRAPPRDQHRPETAPGRTSPLNGWGGPSSDAGAQHAAALPRPPSRSNLSVASSARRSKYGGGGSVSGGRSAHGEPAPSIENMRRAAGVYLQGNAAPGLIRQKGRQPSPRNGRGLAPLSEHGGGGGVGLAHTMGGGRMPWAGGGIGSREELEAALSSAQTALIMAKERISMLEQANAMLRANLAPTEGGGGGGTSVTKAKFVEASQLLSEGLITESDFAAIKAKYLVDSFGLPSAPAAS